MIFVTKFDGRKQPFDKQKIIRTCLRMRASIEQARSIADKIEKRVYDGISTKEILKMIFAYLEEYRPQIKHQIDLREAIALLRPKPDFEHFIAHLMKEYGYKILTNQIVQGKCVDHEIDVIAQKNGEIIYVEVKHHVNPHTFTGMDIFLQAKATFDDLKEGYKLGKNDFNFNKALVVCNTKISEHARRYSACVGINHIGWKHPEDKGLEVMIENRKLYPITFLRTLKLREAFSLLDMDIITLRDLVRANIHEIRRNTGLKRKRIEEILTAASEILKD
jgi:hypothetical protein